MSFVGVHSGNGKGRIETYYVDNAGSDSNNGLTPGTAFATISKINALAFNPGDTVNLKTDCEWVEPLFVRGSGTEAAPIVIKKYGAGTNLPTIKGYVEVTWTKTSGQTNVYEAPLDIDLQDVSIIHRTASLINWWHVWEDRHYLEAATSIANCDSTPESCFYDRTAEIMYIHARDSDDPETNGSLYRIPVVQTGLNAAHPGAGNDTEWITFEDIKVHGIGRYFGAAHNNDDTSGTDHIIFRRCIGIDSKHDGWTSLNNTFFDTCIAENVRANGAFVFNAPDDTGDFSGIQRAEDCIVRPGPEAVNQNQWANGAYHLHHYAGRHGQVQIINCESEGGCRAAIATTDTGIIGGVDIDSVLIDGLIVGPDHGGAVRMDCPTRNITIRNLVMESAGLLSRCIRFEDDDQQDLTIQTSILLGNVAVSSTVIGIDLEGTAGVRLDRVVFDGFNVAVISDGLGQTGAVMDHCTLVNSNEYGLFHGAPGAKVIQKNNLYNANKRHIWGHSTFRIPVSDYNGYGSATTSKFRVESTDGALALWKSVTSEDTNSIDTTVTLDSDYVIGAGSTALTADENGEPVGAAN